MAGTRVGGLKTAAKNLARDPDHYTNIGAKGGRNGHTGGFAANHELARIAGKKGGKISKRGKTDKSGEIRIYQDVRVYETPATYEPVATKYRTFIAGVRRGLGI